jgi:tripartite-type tricarboxylate transporter receptor subunit TctC
MERLLDRRLALGFLASAAFARPAGAQGFPSRPLRLVVPYAPGGGLDITARLVAQHLAEPIGQPVVVENRTGASGMIGVEHVKRSPSDGHTLVIDAAGIAMNPSVTRAPYDPLSDLTPVAEVSRMPFVLGVTPSSGLDAAQSWVAAARRAPGAMPVAITGTSGRLAAEVVRQAAQLDLLFVPYRGAGPALTAVMSGECTSIVTDLASISQHIASGRIRALGIASPARSAILPDVPTLAEQGLQVQVEQWFAIFAPGRTPSAVVDRLNTAIRAVLARPDVVQRLASLGAVPSRLDAPAFTAFFHAEVARWREVVARGGVQIEQ